MRRSPTAAAVSMGKFCRFFGGLSQPPSLFGSERAGAHLRLSEIEIVTMREAMQHGLAAVLCD